MHTIIHIIEHTLLDTLKLLPFLLIAFLTIEYIEHKISNKSKKIISKSGKFGPALGSLLGLIPQCGFSVVATNLYITRIVSLGTLIAIYLSTSDEMLPILISKGTPIKIILLILGIKFIVGLTAGIIIDIIVRKKDKEIINYDLCENEHCGCHEHNNILKSSLIHTARIFLFILIATLVTNIVFEYGGEKVLSKIFLNNSIFAPFITSIVGLIPNCGSSVILTELYLNNAINLSGAISGLLTNSGVAMLILFKSNNNIKDSFKVLGLTYGIGTLTGIIIYLINIII